MSGIDPKMPKLTKTKNTGINNSTYKNHFQNFLVGLEVTDELI
jgi:hypothetical protein